MIDDNAPPPPELRLAWLCGDNHLPESGGMMEQDYKTVTRMRRLENIYRAVHRFRTAEGEQIHQLTDNERRIIADMHDEGFI